MSKFEGHNVSVDAVAYDGENYNELNAFSGWVLGRHTAGWPSLTKQGVETVIHPGDYVVKDQGAVKVVRKADFESSYRAVAPVAKSKKTAAKDEIKEEAK